MPEARTAFIFPAFASDLNFNPEISFPGWYHVYESFSKRANNFFCLGNGDSAPPAWLLETFTPDGSHTNEAINPGNSVPVILDEFQKQCATYIMSCAASAALRISGIIPSVSAGYSMGIYAALFDAGSVSFETGLLLISSAYQALKSVAETNAYGMMVIIGLDRADIQRLIDRNGLDAEITNQNSQHAFIVSGHRHDLLLINELAIEEGALHIRMMDTMLPYHSCILEIYADTFAATVGELTIDKPDTPIISLVDHSLLFDARSIRRELTINLFHPLNWQATLEKIIAEGPVTLIECGPATGLARNSKFISGNFRFFSLQDFVKNPRDL